MTAVTKLSFNNLNQPLPTANDTITLREYEGAPVPQQDAEFNFINITDRINQLIDAVVASDSAINGINTAISDISSTVTENTNNIASNTGDIASNTGNIPTFSYDSGTKTLSITGA